MNEKELKTSPKQRIVISLIAIVMLGSIIASYAAIILNGGKTDSGSRRGLTVHLLPSERRTLSKTKGYGGSLSAR